MRPGKEERRSAAGNIMLLGDRGCREPQVLKEEEFQCVHTNIHTYIFKTHIHLHVYTRRHTDAYILGRIFKEHFMSNHKPDPFGLQFSPEGENPLEFEAFIVRLSLRIGVGP